MDENGNFHRLPSLRNICLSEAKIQDKRQQEKRTEEHDYTAGFFWRAVARELENAENSIDAAESARESGPAVVLGENFWLTRAEKELQSVITVGEAFKKNGPDFATVDSGAWPYIEEGVLETLKEIEAWVTPETLNA